MHNIHDLFDLDFSSCLLLFFDFPALQKTNILCSSELHLPQLALLSESQQLAELSIIQSSVFLRLLRLTSDRKTLLEAMRVIVSLSRVTLFEVPTSEGMARLQQMTRAGKDARRGESVYDSKAYQDLCTLMKSVAEDMTVPMAVRRVAQNQNQEVALEVKEMEIRKSLLPASSRVFRFQFVFSESHAARER